LSLGATKSDGTRKPAVLSKSSWSNDDKKKKFTPNLNIQRKETKVTAAESSTKSVNATSSTGWKKSGKNEASSRTTTKFAKPELIQTSGNFADGVGSNNESKKKAWGSSGGGGGESNTLERPKLDLKAKFDKNAEEKMLKELLRDDFIDDLKSGHMVPVQLPMVDTGKVFKEEHNNHIKKEPSDPDEVLKTAKMKKNRIIDSDDEEDDNSKEVNGVTSTTATTNTTSEITLSDLISEKHSELLFFQMPDHFPGHSRQKVEASDLEQASSRTNVTIDQLAEGYLGKLQFRKSGKVQLWINNVLFDVDIGTQVGFLQELYSVETEPNNPPSTDKGNMTNLGRVRNRVVITPAWNDLLQATNAEDSSSDSDYEDDD